MFVLYPFWHTRFGSEGDDDEDFVLLSARDGKIVSEIWQIDPSMQFAQ